MIEKEAGVLSQIHRGGAGELLVQSSWAGLDPNEPSKFPMKIMKGREGIAAGYIQEPANKT